MRGAAIVLLALALLFVGCKPGVITDGPADASTDGGER